MNLFGDDSTFVEPDLSAICDLSKLSERGCEGAPDLVIEVVSPNNPDMDYVSKLKYYRDAGVREYWICDPMKRQTLVYAFEAGLLAMAFLFDQPVTSSVFEGFSAIIGDIVASM